jgi:hypothetical protein
MLMLLRVYGASVTAVGQSGFSAEETFSTKTTAESETPSLQMVAKALEDTIGWTQLRVAAAAKLHHDARWLLRRGWIDPIDSRASASTSRLVQLYAAATCDVRQYGWYKSCVRNREDANSGGEVSSGSSTSSAPDSERGGSIRRKEKASGGEAAQQALEKCANNSPQDHSNTIILIRAAIAPCSRYGSYWLYPPRTRTTVMVWMLVAARLWPSRARQLMQNGFDVAGAESVSVSSAAGPLPWLPPELARYIAGSVPRML